MKNTVFNILKVLLLIAALIFLELNRNTLIGWFLTALIVSAYIYLYKTTQINKVLLFIAAVLLFAASVFLSWPPYRFVRAVSVKDPKPSEIVTTNYGKVKGVLNKDETVAVYAGIPYARRPVGELRWKQPQEPESYPGTLIADHFMYRSMQEENLPLYDSLTRIIGYHDFRISLQDNFVEPVSEDSLNLNIFKPNREANGLPVLVFVHGGSLQNGHSSTFDYNGENLAKEDIIFVSLTYRLGAFGFLADRQLAEESKNHTTGNYGLLDVLQALKWIHGNIAYFGGDPDNVTLAGESAGAALVSALCTSPLAQGLFERAVLESSTLASKVPPHSYRQFDEALASGEKLKKRYGVSDVNELRSLPAKELVKEADSQHHITVDGYVLTEDPYESYQKGIHNEKAILHGFNSEESGPFVIFSQADMKNYEEKLRYYFGDLTNEVLALYPAETDKQARENWAKVYGALFFNYPHYCLNRLAVSNGIPVYEYRFSKHNGSLGPWHSGEMIYLYGNIPERSAVYDDSDRKLSKTMSSYLVNFVRNGNPNGNDLPEWKENLDSNTLMQFDEKIGIIDDDLISLYAIMDRLYGFQS
ncbi:MAG: carboxylesterase family protein [Erysipelotrichaceae bacterium]|nr:carboxylesterase family protein [Erysipelotrichaceae bacterium]